MRILAIRGKNLASLAGSFEVDFRKPPLERAGLIAITGPTGAGKTTLLDAMCLALFDRTPRFANRGGVVIGAVSDDPTSGLKANDVRGILRHGASEGWAEVDFRGVDDHEFRARWEVRRARGKAEGRIQPQRMELRELATGRPIVADRKQEVIEAIEQRLGLGFDQFRRSVLLAQGEFAAFLEANGAERAELLDRMTGTGLYRQLGKAAWDRSRLIERDLELLLRERAGLQLLDESERTALQQRSRALATKQSELATARDRAVTAIDWHRRQAALAAELAAAQAELAELERAVTESADVRDALGWIDRATPLRARVLAQRQRAGEASERRIDIEFLRGELELLAEQRDDERRLLDNREQQLEQARERRRRVGLELDRARDLDSRRDELRPRHERLKAEADELALQLERLDGEVVALDGRITVAVGEQAGESAWLADHPSWVRLADLWGQIRVTLQRQTRDLAQRDRAVARVAELTPRLEQRTGELESTKTVVAELKQLRQQAQIRVRKLERELDELPPTAELRGRARELERSRSWLAGLLELVGHQQRCEAATDDAVAERARQVAEQAVRASEVDRVAVDIAAAEAAFAEARRALRQLEAVRDLETHRQDLRPGEACPLCGALDHPSAGDPVDAAIDEQRTMVEALLLDRDRLQRQQGDDVGRGKLAASRILDLDRRLLELQRDEQALQARWLEQRELNPRANVDPDSNAPADQLPLLGSGSSETELPDRLADHEAVARGLWAVQDRQGSRARALGDDQKRLDETIERHRAVQQRRDEVDELVEQRRSSMDELARECASLERELARASEQFDQLEHELGERFDELGEVLGASEPWRADWRERLASDGLGFERMLADAVTDVHEHRAGVVRRTALLRDLETRRVEARSKLEARRERASTVADETTEVGRALGQLDAARARLLDGRSVADVHRELEAAEELGLRDRDATKDRVAAVERDWQAHQARITSLQERIDELLATALVADAELALALAELGIDRGELDQVLAREQWWTDEFQARGRAQLRTIDAAHDRQRIVVVERVRVVAAHGEAGQPTLAEAEASAARLELEEGLRSLAGEAFEVEHRLRSDTDARARAGELLPRIEATEARARVWAQLRDAIGDATGTRFQQFAQSLTLELLLAQANAQLRELKPRYALARVPGHDLELQLVDRDFGNEVRSIRGLSGGERFLVSLALALALASLAAEDCRIDSLFIDEGFGTLDASTLDVAVGTLDALHGEGRQIGVISHFPGLAERVGVEIQVEPVAAGKSRVRVVGVV